MVPRNYRAKTTKSLLKDGLPPLSLVVSGDTILVDSTWSYYLSFFFFGDGCQQLVVVLVKKDVINIFYLLVRFNLAVAYKTLTAPAMFVHPVKFERLATVKKIGPVLPLMG